MVAQIGRYSDIIPALCRSSRGNRSVVFSEGSISLVFDLLPKNLQ